MPGNPESTQHAAIGTDYRSLAEALGALVVRAEAAARQWMDDASPGSAAADVIDIAGCLAVLAERATMLASVRLTDVQLAAALARFPTSAIGYVRRRDRQRHVHYPIDSISATLDPISTPDWPTLRFTGVAHASRAHFPVVSDAYGLFYLERRGHERLRWTESNVLLKRTPAS